MVAASHGNGANPTVVSGVGDEALCLCGTGPLLFVGKGSTGFLISVDSPDIQRLPDHGLA